MCLAIPGRIISVEEEEGGLRHGKVDFAGIRKEVCLAYTPEAAAGDYVLVHVGFSISVIDEQEAERIFTTLEEMDVMQDDPG